MLERYRELVSRRRSSWRRTRCGIEEDRRYVLGPPLSPRRRVILRGRRSTRRSSSRTGRSVSTPRSAGASGSGSARAARGTACSTRLRAPDARRRVRERRVGADDVHRRRPARDHPTLLGAYGFLASPRVDRESDAPHAAIECGTLAVERHVGLGLPDRRDDRGARRRARARDRRAAEDTPKNKYQPNGHNYQRPGLTIYLPGNGGLLSATAMMAAGWDGAPRTSAPGFPRDGWTVRAERLRGLP